MKKIFLTLVFLLLASPLIAGDIVISWNANTEPDLTGYKVHYGVAHRVYGTPSDVGNTLTYTITGLTAGTYYISVTAYDSQGNESDYSYELVEDVKINQVLGLRRG